MRWRASALPAPSRTSRCSSTRPSSTTSWSALHARLRIDALSATFSWAARGAKRSKRASASRRSSTFSRSKTSAIMPVGSLSYGLQKRVELGRALAISPKLLLLDEMVSGMNQEEREDIARFILDLKEELGMTMLMVEHDMGIVMDISDHVCVMNEGRKIAEGTPAQVAAERGGRRRLSRRQSGPPHERRAQAPFAHDHAAGAEISRRNAGRTPGAAREGFRRVAAHELARVLRESAAFRASGSMRSASAPAIGWRSRATTRRNGSTPISRRR